MLDRSDALRLSPRSWASNELLAAKLLPPVLAVIAGSTDVIGFLGLGLFTAHTTGNLAVLAVHVVSHGEAPPAVILAVPIFVAVVFLTRLLAAGFDALGWRSLPPLLVLQALLLGGFLAVRVAAGPYPEADAGITLLAGMLGVAAMAVQNALVQISLKGTPATAVMTTNITRLALAVGQMVVGRNAQDRTEARKAAALTSQSVLGFLVGCALGAAYEAISPSWSLALPVALAVLAVAMGTASRRGD